MLQGNYGFRQIVEVAAQNVGGIVYGVARPVQALSVSWWSVEGELELLDPLF